jgi:4-amino-4-deoxy-L-arabinose transferase-like glycosyltransferase
MGGDAREGSSRWFGWGLAAIALVALAVRIAYVLIDRANMSFGGDAFFYHAGANLLAQGRGFIEPHFSGASHMGQAADHPPLYLVFLAIPSFLGMTSSLTHLIWSCMLGTATVVVVGFVGRAVLNPRVGLIAATVAALYPNIWAPDGSLQAETAAMFLTALIMLLAYRYLQTPSRWRLVAIGAVAGAAGLARSELLLYVPLIVVPLALLTRTVSVRRRFLWAGVATLATLVVIGPWVGYNLSRFQHPVYLSSQFDPLLASANCDTAYYGRLTGYFSVPCAAADQRRDHIGGDESEQAIGYRRAALDYIKHHEGRLPVVVAARVGRILNLYAPRQELSLEEFFDRRERTVARAALVSYYALALLSIAGVLMLRRRRIPVFPILAALAVVLITTALTYSNARFRTPAEIMLAILAAVAIDGGIAWIAARRAGRRSGADSSGRSGGDATVASNR